MHKVMRWNNHTFSTDKIGKIISKESSFLNEKRKIKEKFCSHKTIVKS